MTQTETDRSMFIAALTTELETIWTAVKNGTAYNLYINDDGEIEGLPVTTTSDLPLLGILTPDDLEDWGLDEAAEYAEQYGPEFYNNYLDA